MVLEAGIERERDKDKTLRERRRKDGARRKKKGEGCGDIVRDRKREREKTRKGEQTKHLQRAWLRCWSAAHAVRNACIPGLLL